MKFWKNVFRKNERNDVLIFFFLIEVVEFILCEKLNEGIYYKLKCLNRECEYCGVDNFELLFEEFFEDIEE